MMINGINVDGDRFAYDGCHKIYIVENESDALEAKAIGYEIFPLDQITSVYENSCGLRFIDNWMLDKSYVGQFENATFS